MLALFSLGWPSSPLHPPISPTPLVAARVATCPATVEGFAPLLLRDLPSYANRVIVRRRSVLELSQLPSVIVAGQAEFQPLPVVAERSQQDPQLKQLFFTTLEQQRVGDLIRELQQYHWLLVTPTTTGWQVVLSYTRTGSYPQGQLPITPPRESSQGPIAQAVVLWLRDCHAGSVRSHLRPVHFYATALP